MNTIDLKQLYEQRYRITTDPAAKSQNQDPMYWIIPCQYGEIYPYSDSQLAVLVYSSRVSNQMIREFSSLVIHQNAADGVVFLFPLHQFDDIAEYVKPRRIRRLSDDHKRKLAESARVYHFSESEAVLNCRKGGKFQRSHAE